MSRGMRYGMLLLLATVTVGWIGADGSGLLAAEASQRAETWEFYMPIRYIGGQTLDFDGGTKLDISDDLGWGFGFGYNLNEKMELTFDFAWMSAGYTVDYATDLGGTVSASGDMDVSTTNVTFNYNFMPKTITPYISGGIGWNWIDTNIPTGSDYVGCYWDPWYGYICYEYQETVTESGFSYGLGLGVRFEPKESFYFRVGLNNMWQDFGTYADTPDFLTYRIDMGWKF